MSTYFSPTQTAREALRLLAMRRITPTPENFRMLYDEISGKEGAEAERAADYQVRVAANALLAAGQPAAVVNAITEAAENKSWERARGALTALAQVVLERTRETGVRPADKPPEPTALRDQAGIYRDVIAHILESSITHHLSEKDDLTQEARGLVARLRSAQDDGAVTMLAQELRRFCTKLEARAEDVKELRDGLTGLLRLLVDNIGDLIVEDTWITHQLEVMREIIGRPPALHLIEEAEQFLREVLLKQRVIKNGLKEAKATIKGMVSTFIDQLAVLSQDTGDYGRKIDDYSTRLAQTDDIAELGQILDELQSDTRRMGDRVESSHRELVSARTKAQAAESRIEELERDLLQVSEKLREDQLTGALNRRGLDEAFAREVARAKRYGRPLCIALLDVDDFKQVNDSHGHGVGDEVLVHLTRVVRETVRPNDVVARYGGEEFLLILPETTVTEAMPVMKRIQRELTKRIYLHNNEKILITFSAGVTSWESDDSQDSVMARADRAQYEAKRLGKNRVVAAKQATEVQAA